MGFILECQRVGLPLPSLYQFPESLGWILLSEKVGKIFQISIVRSPGVGAECSQVRGPELLETIQEISPGGMLNWTCYYGGIGHFSLLGCWALREPISYCSIFIGDNKSIDYL
jgi:hypothetical protein